VLRSVYDFDDTAIARAIEGALGLPRVQWKTLERVKLALAAVADRIDIADALHVASNAQRCSGLRNLRSRSGASRQRATGSNRGSFSRMRLPSSVPEPVAHR